MNIMVLWKITIIVYLSICTLQELVEAECDETAEHHYYRSGYDYGDDYYRMSYPSHYRNFLQKQNVKSISVHCHNVDLRQDGPLPALYRKQYDCSGCPETLKVTESSIHTISISAFNNYPSTTILEMKNVEIQNIVPGAFDILTSLEELNLSGNHISNISDGIFNSLAKLRVLDLSNNHIQNISEHAFSGTTSLQALNLASNSLKHIDSYLLHQLKELDISFNKITKFYFSDMSENAKDLNLANNQIDSIYGCFATFDRLNLNNNLLTSLQNITCTGNVSNIKELELSHNLISKMDKIPGLRYVSSISLDNNKINFIPPDFFSELSELNFLNISSNELTQFQYGFFDRLGHLEILDVSNNHLTGFTKFNYHMLSKLRKLYLNDNEITTLDFNDVTRILPKLRELSISGNKFNCETLLNIIQDIRKNSPYTFYASDRITLLPGHTVNSSNIHGIACTESESGISPLEENADGNTTLYNSLKRKLYDLFNVDFANSTMYNYLNKGFVNSNFYKYLEAFKRPQFPVEYAADTNITKVEKLVSPFDHLDENNNNSAPLVVIILLLIIISCNMFIFLYIGYYKKRFSVRNEHVELIESC